VHLLPFDWKVFWFFVVAAIVVRGGLLAAMAPRLRDDPDAYRLIAGNLVQHQVFSRSGPDQATAPTAYRPPLYPMLLAVVSPLGDRAGVALLHLLLGVGTAAITYLLGVRWNLGRGSLIASGLVICDPLLLNQSALVMTETLAAFLAVLALYLITVAVAPSPDRSTGRTVAACLGVVLGLACLCRPTFLPWTGLMVLWILFQRHRSQIPWKNVAITAGCAAAVLSPWVIRNTIVFGKPIVATTHGGYTLWLGNNKEFYAYLRAGEPGALFDANALPPLTTPEEATRPDSPAWELALNAKANERAKAAIADEPGMFAYACCIRVARLWSPLPHAVSPAETLRRTIVRYAVAVWNVLLSLTAATALIIAVVKKQWPNLQRWSPGLLLCLCTTGVHVLYWSNIRMRAPLIPFLCLLAAQGLVAIIKLNKPSE